MSLPAFYVSTGRTLTFKEGSLCLFSFLVTKDIAPQRILVVNIRRIIRLMGNEFTQVYFHIKILALFVCMS